MKRLFLCLVAVWSLALPASRAQSAPSTLVATWQGTLEANGRSIRLVFKIAKAADGNMLKTTLYNIDQAGGQGITADETTLQGSTVKIAANVFGFAYEGKLAADGNSVAGTWTQGGAAVPLTMVRATKETAWAIPDAPAPPKMMAADADPSFDVATIKPNNTGATGMQQLTVNGRNFKTRASSLGDLISLRTRCNRSRSRARPSGSTPNDTMSTRSPTKRARPAPTRSG